MVTPSEVKMPVVACLTLGEHDSPAMLFFECDEALQYCDFDESPADLVRQSDALAYADAKVREALERAAKTCEAMHEEDRPGDYAYAIRALAQEVKTNG